MKFKPAMKITISYAITVFLAVLLAFNYQIFIVQNNFAPAGINGIMVMVQYKTHFSLSFSSLLVNIPLCILAFFLIKRKYAVKSLVFALVYSFTYLYLQGLDLSFLQYDAGGHDSIFPVIISGVISGFVSGIGLRINCATGGTEIISKYISKIKPGSNFFMVFFVLNAFVAAASLFVYSDNGVLNYKPVALCLTYCFVSSIVGNYIIKGTKTAYKFTIISPHANEIAAELIKTLKRGVTKIAAEGEYTHSQKDVLLCVVSKNQLVEFKTVINKYSDTFSFCETVNETFGTFNHNKTVAHKELHLDTYS